MITINVPKGGPSHIFDRQGRVYRSRMEGDCLVCDVLPEVFRTLLGDRHMGLAWQSLNPEAVQLLARS